MFGEVSGGSGSGFMVSVYDGGYGTWQACGDLDGESGGAERNEC